MCQSQRPYAAALNRSPEVITELMTGQAQNA